MPVLDSSYRAPFWLRSGHLQTVAQALMGGHGPGEPRRERMELEDGDFLDLDWWRGNSGESKGLAVICHGLEGSSSAGYVLRTASALRKSGWDVLAWNYRGCSGEPNRLARSYHSGGTEDLARVIDHARREVGDDAKVALVGFSLGGNVALKYAGERGDECAVEAAVAISAPVDLASSAVALDERRGNRVYLARFLRTLTGKVRAKGERFPGRIDARAYQGVTSIRMVDEYYTAPVHGFEGAADYYARCSARGFLAGIRVPSLLLNAANDPLLDEPSYPVEAAQESAFFHLESPDRGGHVAFLGGGWLGMRITSFLSVAEKR